MALNAAARFARAARARPVGIRAFAAASDPGAVRIDLDGCFKAHRKPVAQTLPLSSRIFRSLTDRAPACGHDRL